MDAQEYFQKLGSQIDRHYEVANEARSRGKDVETRVECMPAADKNNRCIEILSTMYPQFAEKENREKILARLDELEKEYGIGSDPAALEISKEIALEKFFKFKDRETAVAAGLRFGCAFNTKGVVGAPLEGITNVKIDPKDKFLYVYYAGPIRTAGGTAQVFTLFLADHIRRALGLSIYKATKEEMERYYTELNDYLTYVTRKQYKPSEEEVNFLVSHVPICLTGEATEQREVSRHKDCERAETTRIRGGMCLVYLDGLPLKAEKLNKKLKKYGEKMGLVETWSWLEEFIKIKKGKKADGGSGGKVYKFLEEVPAGRPVYAMPDRKGGFRLRYGRSRAMGSGCFGFHPATQAVLDSFPAVASQMKIEVPGKGCTVSVCDYIEPPIAKMKNGDVVQLHTLEEAKAAYKDIDKILFVGDMLVTYGDFVENGEKLIPTPYVEEVWKYDLEDAKEAAEDAIGKEKLDALLKDPKTIDAKTAIALAEKGIPLHPKYLQFYDGISAGEMAGLARYLQSGEKKDGRLVLKNNEGKLLLEKAIIPHKLSLDKLYVVIEDATPLIKTFEGVMPEEVEKEELSGYALLDKYSQFKIMEKATKYVGARMGRPEKSMLRKMKGSPQILFPVGEKGGRMRNLVDVENLITELSEFVCPEHGASVFPYCLRCGRHLKAPTQQKKQIYVRGLLNEAYQRLQEPRLEMIKGVKGVVSKRKVPEPIEKGILRAKHGLYVFRDGTIRFDMVNAPITHFKPRETGTSIEKLKELGYTHDVHGQELTDENQVIEMFPQDLLLSKYGEESAADYFLSVSKFIDDLLVKFYGLPAFYNAKTPDDLVGQLFLDIAPHTIAPVVCRLIGFTDNRCHYAHPYLFAATRRDCDGEENGVILMMDCLLNFSKEYISERRGSISDAPLTISTILNLGEVDDEVYDMDIAFRYPKEFYQKTRERLFPWETGVKIEQVNARLGKDTCYSGLGYTTENTSINLAVHLTTYKTAEDMVEKINRQLDLAKKLKCVDERFVAQKILSSHFIKDIKGNFRTFFSQTFRCTSCNNVIRRPPLAGKCPRCNGPLVLTVSEGTIVKYLEASKKIAEDFNMDSYTINQLNMMQNQLNNIFGKKARQSSLAAF
ncbi:MAG: DNA polymerase II large subunit [Candidatus Aenigmarchaeota archaeon]|nr:DNA polymerase II large subunit [Candidatus Aenigmarchaeota archaeon]